MKQAERHQAKLLGEKHFFTGKPCKRGHIAKRLTSTGTCTECSRVLGKIHDAKRRNCNSRKEYMNSYLKEYSQRVEYKEIARSSHLKFYEKNKEAVLQKSREKQKKNSAYYAMKCAERRSAKKQATPLWFDEEAVKIVYEKAKKLKMQVDHIVPLQSELVCGLHTWDNLQLLKRRENLKKSNSFWPDMPE